MDISEAVYSNDYINLIVSTTENPADNVDIFSCEPLFGGFRILYIRKESCALFTANNTLSTEYPFILTLMGEQDLRSAGIYQVLESPYTDLTGNGIIFGIVDTGINYTSKSFIYENNTSKILDIWDQTEGTGGEFTCYGTEYTNEQINAALKSENPYDIVPQRDENGHGTKLAEIVSGRRINEFVGAAPDSRIVCVKVKQVKDHMREYIRNDVFCCDSSDVMNGVNFILQKAQQYRMPAVILIGMGTNDGSHSGESYFERYLSFCASRPGIAICTPSGNEADKSHHAFSDLSGEYSDFEIQTNNNRKGFIINFWSYSANRFSISVNLPTQERLEKIYLVNGFNQNYYFPLSGTSIAVNADYPIGSSVSQRIQLKFKNIVDGIWNIRIYYNKTTVKSLNGWLPVENLTEGDVRFLSPDPFYTATVPSTSATIIPSGGYSSSDGSIYAPSGRGPTGLDELVPYFTAPAVSVSSPSGSITGTSAASAITAGAAILLMQWGYINRNNININTIVINSYLIGGADVVNTGSYPDYIWGFGKINLYNSFSEAII